MRTPLPSVLFVDDDVILLEGVKRALHGVRGRLDMTFISDPEEALDHYSRSQSDVVVSDLHMPCMDGLDMVARMIKIDKSDRTRFLFLTGASDFDMALRAINELHISSFLQKPIVRDGLITAIDAALEDLIAEDVIGGRHAAAALEMINAAVLVVSVEGRVLFSNPAGQRFLDSDGGLSRGPDGICRAPTPDETRTLHAALRDTAIDPDERVRWLRFKPDEWGNAVSLVAIPRTDNMADESVILFSTDGNSKSALSRESIQVLFGLSPAEASIALALSMGERIEQAAELSGVTLSSARTYLKRVFQKTGVSRQSDLVKKVLMSPAAFMEPPAPL